MTIGIYCIEHITTGRKYIGKSVNIEARWSAHKWALQQSVRGKDSNRYLWGSVQKHGIEAFKFSTVETFVDVNEALIAERELFWMDHYCACDRHYGFNLRRDSSSRMLVHPETIALITGRFLGSENPNFGNKWTPDQKAVMSDIAKARHEAGVYGDAFKKKISERATSFWANNPETKLEMARKLAIVKRKYAFIQQTRDGVEIARWGSIAEIVAVNPSFKWQNIYSVCNGYKPTYMNYVWKKELLNG